MNKIIMNFYSLVNSALGMLFVKRNKNKFKGVTYNEAKRIQEIVGEELFGIDGKRWPTMIGTGVGNDETTGEPTVFVSFLKGTQPSIEDFPRRIKGIKITMRVCKQLPSG